MVYCWFPFESTPDRVPSTKDARLGLQVRLTPGNGRSAIDVIQAMGEKKNSGDREGHPTNTDSFWQRQYGEFVNEWCQKLLPGSGITASLVAPAMCEFQMVQAPSARETFFTSTNPSLSRVSEPFPFGNLQKWQFHGNQQIASFEVQIQ